MSYIATLMLGALIGYAVGNWHDPAFRWGFLHPFSPPAPWWPQQKRVDWLWDNGYPWERAE